MKCTCGTQSVNPSLPIEKHPDYCDSKKKYSQRWDDFQTHLMYDYTGGRYLYVTDDRTRLAYSAIFADILDGEKASKAIDQYQYQEVWIEEDCCLATEVYEKAIKKLGNTSIVRLLRDY